MKVRIMKSNKEIFGIELIAETNTDHGTLLRFLEGGIKINSHGSSSLQLTYRDLMSKDSCVVMLLEESLKEAKELLNKRVNENIKNIKIPAFKGD